LPGWQRFMSMNSDCYDAVVIGSGFGGAAAGYALARAGRRVLLIERAGPVKRDAADWDQKSILLDKRYRGTPLEVDQRGKGFEPLDVNQALGGMSVFYGGASLRLRPGDFTRWPFSYAEMAPYYAHAEELLEVHGHSGEDPYEPPRQDPYPFVAPKLNFPAQRLFEAGRSLGWRPFRLPLAINFSNNSRPLCIQCNTCDGFPCQIRAKNDLSATLLPQAQKAGLELLAGVAAVRLVHEGGRVAAVECVEVETGRALRYRAETFVAAAGAIQSPALLLRSGLEGPHIGHNLMRHCNAVVTGIFPFRTNPEEVFHKQLCFSDFYEDQRQEHGLAVGLIQDIYTPAPVVISHFAPWGGKWIARGLTPYMQNLLCIAEDEPQVANTVTLGTEKDALGLPQVRVRHYYSDEDRRRLRYLIGKARRILRRAGAWITWTHGIDTFSHAVGTLRMGTTPDEGALDPQCRLWGMDNLYVLDGSFMPSSSGVNPSLTIAANALRVAEGIAAD
jgi:choline dehydrogenase-like flavoprotein